MTPFFCSKLNIQLITMNKLLLAVFLLGSCFLASCVKTLHVNPDHSISLSLDTIRVVVGSAAQIASKNYSNSDLTWESADTTVVSVSVSGLAHAKKAGRSLITVKSKLNNASATCVVIVTAPPILGGAITQITGIASDIGIGADSSIFVIGIDSVSATGGYSISRVIGGSLIKMPDCAGIRIAVSPAGVPWVVNKSHLIYRFNGTLWDVLPGTANDIGIGADGSVYIIGTTIASPTGGFNIMKWNGVDWVNLPDCAGTRISVMPDGTPWVVNKSSIVYQKTSSDLWQPIPGVQGNDIGIGADGTVYVTGKDNNIYKYNAGSWAPLTDAKGISIAVSPHGKPWWIDNTGKIFKLN